MPSHPLTFSSVVVSISRYLQENMVLYVAYLLKPWKSRISLSICVKPLTVDNRGGSEPKLERKFGPWGYALRFYSREPVERTNTSTWKYDKNSSVLSCVGLKNKFLKHVYSKWINNNINLHTFLLSMYQIIKSSIKNKKKPSPFNQNYKHNKYVNKK